METWQKILILIVGLVNLIAFLRAIKECKDRGNVFELTKILSLFGIFVWGDALVLGLFWILVSAAVILLNDWILFLLIISLFWVVRGLGETIYWFNQQFSSIKRNPPNTLYLYWFFKNDSIWFIYQLAWQCVTVVSLVVSIFLANQWLS